MPKTVLDENQNFKFAADRKVDSICPYCGVGCQLTYNIKDDKIISVSGRPGPANKSRLCVKGRYGFDYISSSERITKPLIRLNSSKKTKNNSWEIFSHGGTKETGIDAISFAKDMQKRGAGEILLTSMDKDGTKNGYDVELTKLISDSLNIPIIASGGAGKLEHFKSIIEIGNASAILAASIFHFGEISINKVKSYLKSEGIPVRI